jgi:nucleoside-diphosphate-sugar epimerase
VGGIGANRKHPGQFFYDNLIMGVQRRCLDTSRAAEWFGFRATTPFVDGLRETIAWYRAQQAIGGQAA